LHRFFSDFVNSSPTQPDPDIALEWYLNSLSSADIQSGYIQAFTVLELLKDRYNKKIDKEYIIPEPVLKSVFRT